jgi:SAM-dependent methyltransferase
MTGDVTLKVSRQAFEARYASLGDPWNFETSSYERNRYKTLLRTLSKAHYDVVYEPGCSVGVLTADLAALANRVIATDVAPSAVARARERCRAFDHVDIHCDDVATFAPNIALDLIVFSEIGYYFERHNLERIARTLASNLQSGGEFVAAHWLGDSSDHVLHGDEVHEILTSSLPLRWTQGQHHEGFRIDTWMRP